MSDTSKFLSLVLRHKPETIGISLDAHGWVSVDVLIEKINPHLKSKLTIDSLKNIVDTNDKKRFAFSPDGLKIRANQGHSLTVDLGLKEVKPPEILFHGTIDDFVSSIKKKGLLKQSRHHVHLSKDRETAIKVASRRGAPVILEILSRKMHDQGFKFYLSENGVWLTDHVPAEFIK